MTTCGACSRNLSRRLRDDHPGAAASLDEGLDERQLSTTNAIENLMGAVRQLTRRVKRWHGGRMIVRWSVTAVADSRSLPPRHRRARRHDRSGARAQGSREHDRCCVAQARCEGSDIRCRIGTGSRSSRRAGRRTASWRASLRCTARDLACRDRSRPWRRVHCRR
jgi:hypothetical protein